MTTISATRRIQFCAGHRVCNHESKCRNPHGHNYVLYITCESRNGTLPGCPKGPDGWHCTREPGHGGPCALCLTEDIPAVLRPLDKLGRVIDFSVIKDIVGSWIDKNWDHGFIYWDADPEMFKLFTMFATSEQGQLGGYKNYPLPFNPTAENMARYLLLMICPDLLKDTDVRVTRIKLEETENCFVEVSL